ncbi:ABC transporter permease [Sediminispirochaeta smaragdinae]|uniref:Inner-membrane translocator n=1 Tax=Sediminispirochaeta smaragdinae (strain DSM 11293 / JCM 15392 / SEBR 4228) TaxID=573413 RepID=E1R2I6_SEDSS|nr:ABC transporter permease [Sediminispirochaeta smaragdinae]ADK82546.1 inner-membrane translocator [Sediminispirochaeta smaragdinae DSM 11293]
MGNRYLSKGFWRIAFEKYGTVLILLAMMIIMTFLKPGFLTVRNLTNILRQQTPVAIMAIGVAFTIISGGIDISGGSVIAMSAVILAKFAQVNSTGTFYPIIVPIIAGILTGSLAGAVTGISVSYGKIPPFIATLGMMSAARGVALIVSKGRPITGFSSSFDFIGGGDFLGIPILVFILIVAYIIGYIILHKTKFGTYIFAIGSSQVAAEVSGVNVKKTKILIYTLSGLFTGIAAILVASRTLSGQPGVGSGWEMQAITAVVLGGASFSGGIGTAIGTLIGALIMGVLTNSMTMLQIDPASQMVVRGAVIVLAVLLDERRNKHV